MASKANLPAFRSNPVFPVPSEHGKWLGADNDLKKLSASLQVNSDNPWNDDDEPIRAVPDPWAQPRTFGEALLDRFHTLHATSLAQWRGLLALMALRERRRDNYRLMPVSAAVIGDTPFERVMSTLTPEIGIINTGGALPDDPRARDAEEKNRANAVRDLWRTPSLIMLHDPVNDPAGNDAQAFAMTNPICLISPGRNSHKHHVPGAFWADGKLGDPLIARGEKRLSGPERTILRAWLEAIRGNVDQQGRATGLAVWGKESQELRQLLAEYIKDCGSDAIAPTDRPVEIGEPEHRNMPELFRLLWTTASEGSDERPAWQRSQCRVRLYGMERTPSFNGIIFADKALKHVPGIDPHSFVVWGDHVLEEVVGSRAVFDRLRGEMAHQGWLLAARDDLFTDRAVRLANEPMIAGHPAGLQDTILPLRPLALLTARKLKDSVRGSSSANRAAVTLTIELETGGRDPMRVDLTRFYSPDPSEEDGLLVPKGVWDFYNASLWPNFKSDSWATYLARFSYPESQVGKMALPSMGLSAALISKVAAAGGNTAVAHLKSLNDGEMPQLSTDLFRMGRWQRRNGRMAEIVQFSSLPCDALIYREGRGPERPEALGGMVLLDLPEQQGKSNSTRVAVDFGTTSTVACIGSDSAEPVVLKNRLVFPVRHKDPKTEQHLFHSQRESLTGFMPPESRMTPVASVADAREPYKSDETLWAFRNLIYFHTTQPPAEGDEQNEIALFHSMTTNARFNLKWSDDERDRDAATDYLEQFMVMVSAELYDQGYDPAKTVWLFSAPEAMSRDARQDLFSKYREKVKRISPDVAEGRDENIEKMCSEGISAARYMKASRRMTTDGVMITLDIGGGTTDVTLWGRDDPVWKGSIYLAGQRFFTRLLCENPQILESIGLSTWAGMLGAAKSGGGIPAEKVSYLAEMLFSGRTGQAVGADGAVGTVNPLEMALENHWTNRVKAKAGEPLRHTGLVFIAGVAWYLGRITGHLIKQGLLTPHMADEVAFAVCGRGGGLFKRLHENGRPDESSIVTRALAVYGVAADLTDAKRPEFAASPAAKLEVVRGMLAKYDLISPYMDDLDDEKGRFDSRDMLSGIEVQFRNGEIIRADDVLTGKQPDSPVDKVDISELELFLDALGDKAGVHVNLTDAARNSIRKEVRIALDEARQRAATGRKRGSKAPEAPFVIALRTLVDLMAQSPEDRQGVVETEAG